MNDDKTKKRRIMTLNAIPQNVGRVIGYDGKTPEIRNNTWWIGDINTGVDPRGLPGEKGEKGDSVKGDPGQDGQTPRIQNDYWWIGSTNTGVPARGQDGETPRIINDIWWIGSTNTGVPARGKDGIDGKSFIIKGLYPTIEDLKRNHPRGNEGDAWAIGTREQADIWIWDVDRDEWVNIGPIQGPPGADGFTPEISQNNTWLIDGVDTGKPSKGEDADIWEIIDNYWHKNGEKTNIKAIGEDGFNPYISDDFYWVTQDGKTAVKALGEDGTSFVIKGMYATIEELRFNHPIGEAGDAWAIGTSEKSEIWTWDTEKNDWVNLGSIQGPPGKDADIWEIRDDYWYKNGSKTEHKAVGDDGSTPLVGPNENWWTNGVDTGNPSRGKPGHSPKIEIRDGFWWIDDVNTGVDARGIKGDDGHSPVVEIRNNYWYIDNHNTGIKAVGEDGHTPVIGENENWFINNKDSGKPSRGPAGRDGASNIEYVKLKSDFDEIKWSDLKKDTLYVIGSGKKKPQPPPMPPTPNTHTRRDSTSPAWESFFDKINSQDLSYWILYDFPTHLYSEKVLKRMDIFLNGVQKGTSQTSTATTIPHIVLRGSDHEGEPKHYIVLCKTTPEFQPLFQEYSATWTSIFFNMIESQANTWGRYANTSETSTVPIRYHEDKPREFFTSQGIHIDPYRTPEGGVLDNLTILSSVQIDKRVITDYDFWLGNTDMIEVSNHNSLGKGMWWNGNGSPVNWINNIKRDYPEEPYYALHKLEYKKEGQEKDREGNLMPSLVYNENITDHTSQDRKVDVKNLPGYNTYEPDKLGKLLAANPYWWTNTAKERTTHPAVVVAFPKTVVNNEELDKELKFEYPKPQPSPDPVPDMNQKFYYHTEDQFID